jgi:hypothetical protein
MIKSFSSRVTVLNGAHKPASAWSCHPPRGGRWPWLTRSCLESISIGFSTPRMGWTIDRPGLSPRSKAAPFLL